MIRVETDYDENGERIDDKIELSLPVDLDEGNEYDSEYSKQNSKYSNETTAT